MPYVAVARSAGSCRGFPERLHLSQRVYLVIKERLDRSYMFRTFFQWL